MRKVVQKSKVQEQINQIFKIHTIYYNIQETYSQCKKYINEHKIGDFKERKFESYFPFYDPAMANFSHGIKCSTLSRLHD